MQDFDNMPMRESMRDSHKKEPVDVSVYIHEALAPLDARLKKDYRVIDRKLKRSLNQNYDNIYSWLRHKYKTNPDFGYLKSYFLDQFKETAQTFNKGERAKYCLDNQKNIVKIK